MTDLTSEAVSAEPRSLSGRPCYLPTAADPLFAMLHLPQAPARPAVGVLLCASFGWDELSAHRTLRALGAALASAGHAALRFDLPGTGDSGGSARDGARLDAWTAAVAAAAGALRAAAGCERVVAFGIGLGGMLACRAVAEGADIDDLALWAVPSRGSHLLRELRAFARMSLAENVDSGLPVAPHAGAQEHPAGDPDDLDVAGYLLSAETVEALQGLDLTRLRIPAAARRHALLIGRDTLPPDRRLREHLAGAGMSLTVCEGPGYDTMMVDTYLARVPEAVLESVVAWVGERAGEGPVAVDAHVGAAPPAQSAEIAVGDATVLETPFAIEFDGDTLHGVLCEPLSAGERDFCVVLLNAGAVRRIGPGRMWVEAARRWAALGVPTLRFDVVGVGDSDGDERSYVDRGAFQREVFSAQVIAALDELERRGLPRRFLVGGVCSGAYWGLHAGLVDDRVSGLLLVNLLAFRWSAELGAARDSRRARTLLREGNIGMILRILASDRWRITRMLVNRIHGLASLGRRRGGGGLRYTSSAVAALERLRERGVQTLLLFSLDEPLYDDLVADGLLDRLGEWPNVTVERFETNEHIFRPVWWQRQLHRALDGAVARMLEP